MFCVQLPDGTERAVELLVAQLMTTRFPATLGAGRLTVNPPVCVAVGLVWMWVIPPGQVPAPAAPALKAIMSQRLLSLAVGQDSNSL